MKKLILIYVLLFTALTLSAQTSSLTEARKAELRQKIGIDYSMPDFNTSSINGKVIGDRLAKMLKKLEDRADDYVFNQRISFIQCEQLENVNYVKVEKLRINKIIKVGDVITIKANTKLAPNSAKIKNADLIFVFDKGITKSQAANDLFSDLSRYIKD